MMIRAEARRRHRVCRRLAEVDHVHEQLQDRLVLAVATGHADRVDWFLVLEHDRWRECHPRSFARLNAIRMAGPVVEALQAAPEPNARLAYKHSGEPARRRGDNVA